MTPSLKTRWIARRNAILGNPRFQRWAARFPLTRPLVRHHARDLFFTVTGFVYTQTALATLQSGLLDRLAQGPTGLDDAAAATGLSNAAADRLLKAAASIGLAESVGCNVYMLGQAGVALKGNPGIAAMIAHHRLLYADLADPVALLKREGGGGSLSGFWPYAEARAGEAASYSTLMAASQPMVAEQVIGAYDFGRHRRLLDIGGGAGAFVAAVKAAHPALDCAVFDLPDVAALAAAKGLTAHGGSFLTEALPQGFDCLTLIRIAHDHDDAAVLTLFRAARAALAPGGRLVIGEPMVERGKDARVGDAYFGMYLLAMGSGRARRREELAAMLRSTGFTKVRFPQTALPLVTGLIIAA
jgi:demethylspheroidene O-methyltransferase